MWNRLVLLVHILLRCPQGSVLGPLFFVMYTTPISTLIFSCSLNHHLYADDTQLFLSFLPTDLDSSIDHLHNALDRISSWMTANLLTLNTKTEFLLIGLSKQLAKINNSSLTTTHSLRNLGFNSYLMNTSLFLTRSHLSPTPAITISVSFAVSVHTSIPKHSHFHCSLQAWLLHLSLSQPAQVSDHPAPTDPELSCTCCCQSSQIHSHNSYPPVSTLAKDKWAH